MPNQELSVLESHIKSETVDFDALLKRAKREWYRDDDAGRPHQVWAYVPKDSAKDLSPVVRHPDITTGDDYWVWHFESNQDAVRLFNALHQYERLNYLRIGLS